MLGRYLPILRPAPVIAPNALTTQVGAVQKQLTGALQTKGQLDAVKKDVASTSAALKAQERQLSDTSELVKMLFSKSITEQFPTTNNSDRIVVWVGPKQSRGALVCLLLQDAPILQTLQLQWHIYVQPRKSYFTLNGFPNVVIFSWGDPVETLKQHPLDVTYVPDKSSAALIKTLSIKDNIPYADGKPLFTMSTEGNDTPKK